MKQVEFLIEMMPVEIHLWVVSDGVKSKVTVMKFQLEEIVGLLLTGYFSASCRSLMSSSLKVSISIGVE